MSFSNEVKIELLSLQIKKNCCKKAFMLGLLYNSEIDWTGNCRAVFGVSEAAEAAKLLLGSAAEADILKQHTAGRIRYVLEFTSKSVYTFLNKVSFGKGIEESALFKCGNCASCFLRGAIIASASISAPQKGGYHFELSFSEDKKARRDALAGFMSELGFAPKLSERQNKASLYFKSNTNISDILSFAGAMRASFDIANTVIERDIRNNENRATNCVATNISKSVDANKKQRDAIKKLIAFHRYDGLPAELRETARLRLENEEATLSELSMLHEPPISKSGLNHRLAKLCKLADECEE